MIKFRKHITCIIFLFFLLSCKNFNKQEREANISKSISSSKIKNPKNNSDNLLADKVIQIYGGNDTIRFSRKRLNLAYKLIPEFSDEIVKSPDDAYSSRPKPLIAKNDEEKDFLNFGCEVCQDDYMLMYAYFLKQKNLGNGAERDRKFFISIYRLINSIYSELRRGGAFFGHQYYRIYAYAEYSVYLQTYYGKDYENSYSVLPQKAFFIGSLKQLIDEDEKYNMDVNKSEKQSRKVSLFKKVNQLNSLITNHFYLKEAQKFNYSQY